MGKIKTIAKKALKATPPGMMVTAGKKVVEEFKRLTKRKKPKYGKDLTTKQKEKILKQPRKAPPKVVRDRRNKRKK
jgi:hypothetical protein